VTIKDSDWIFKDGSLFFNQYEILFLKDKLKFGIKINNKLKHEAYTIDQAKAIVKQLETSNE
jgi:hypothetical protein